MTSEKRRKEEEVSRLTMLAKFEFDGCVTLLEVTDVSLSDSRVGLCRLEADEGIGTRLAPILPSDSSASLPEEVRSSRRAIAARLELAACGLVAITCLSFGGSRVRLRGREACVECTNPLLTG